MSKIEILAPVGSEEMLRAAVFSGADAVYLGFSGFNARTGAGNFDADSLKEAVRFCHARGVEATIHNIGRLGKDGMKVTNEEIIKMMIEE